MASSKKDTKAPRYFAPDPKAEGKLCDAAGCSEEAGYRAPKTRKTKDGYYWFCLDHVREYNANWNYFRGLSPAQMEAEIKHSTIWDRPTWKLDGRGLSDHARRRLNEELNRFFRGEETFSRSPSLPPIAQKALRTLDLEWPLDEKILKKRYYDLARSSHPDLHPSRKEEAQEEFKKISEAYQILSSLLDTLQKKSS